jgi:hypothetical protein
MLHHRALYLQFSHHSPFISLITIWYVLLCVTYGYKVTTPPLKQPAPVQQLAVNGVFVHRVPLRYNNPTSPYTLAVTSSSNDITAKGNVSCYNFLATQVWPSARTAAIAIEQYFASATCCAKPTTSTDSTNSVCEFGCGPGLPSLTAALCGASHVIATDIDDLALALVHQASVYQDIQDKVETRVFDLTQTDSLVPEADIYIFSDVFESNFVAKCAAQISAQILLHPHCCNSKVWVFAQSDRAQRDTFLQQLQILLCEPSLAWCNPQASIQSTMMHEDTFQWNGRLWLCSIDETNVFYG